MPDTRTGILSYDLWTEPWISVETPDGQIENLGLAETLRRAHALRGLYDPSPLVIAGLHRLLTAILQSALAPRKTSDLRALWRAGCFSESKLEKFHRAYSDRFDLFSPGVPFLQTADLPVEAGKDSKTVGYLFPDIPAHTEITHFRHGGEGTRTVCPACAARGLVCIPAFATSGGAGIKPSINGVPPLYVLPGGDSLFESLAASLLCPAYFPEMADPAHDQPWWEHAPQVPRSAEVRRVGYLHSLTFPARRVRLHPLDTGGTCSRCGAPLQVGVRTMVYEMGECRPEGAAFWFDPFAAYKLPSGKGKDRPMPIRPTAGKALWREYASLFLRPGLSTGEKDKRRAPAFLSQLAELDLARPMFAFRCIGMRTDMKAKVFEWVDAGFMVPPALLRDDNAGPTVTAATEFTSACARVIAFAFQQAIQNASRRPRRHAGVKARMLDDYWSALAEPFRYFVLQLAASESSARATWADAVAQAARSALLRAAESLGDDAAALRQRARAERIGLAGLSNTRKEYLND